MSRGIDPRTGGAPRERPVVAAVTPVFPPSVGGAELYYRKVSEALAQHADVTVFTSDLNLDAGDRRRFVPPGGSSLRVHYLPSFHLFGERLISPWRLFSLLGRLKPDVVWTGHPSVTGDLAAAYALASGASWVASYHGDLEAHRFYATAYTFGECRWLRRANRVLVHSDRYAQTLRQRGCRVDRVVPIAPGPGLDPGDGTGVAGPPPVGPGSEHPFLFVGGLDSARSYKQPALLLQALRSLLDRGIPAFVEFVGDGDRRAWLEREARRIGAGESVRFCGWVSDAELARHYREAWALVLPSTESEGFGIVCIEAATFGCPTVASTAVPAAVALSETGSALLFDPYRPDQLADAMAQLWSDPARRANLALRARAASGQYSWGAALPRLVNGILAPASGPPGKIPA